MPPAAWPVTVHRNGYLPALLIVTSNVWDLPGFSRIVFLPAILKSCSRLPLFVTLNAMAPFAADVAESLNFSSDGFPAVTVTAVLLALPKAATATTSEASTAAATSAPVRNLTTSPPLVGNRFDSSYPRLVSEDRLGRPLRDLRISVTDRCNFRCVYCMPKEVFGSDYRFLDRKELLSFEEIERVARVFVGLGVEKLRLTGGEPLVRKDVEQLVAKLAPLGVELTLTTNASLLAVKAQALASAGLHRVTVSLDSLDDKTFQAMNDVDFPVARVLEGIEAAAAAGMPVKVNAVVKRGLNEHAILPLARHFRAAGHTLRFIEYMDVGATNGWRLDDVVPAAEIVERISAEFPLEPVPPRYRGEVATRWRYRDGAGEIGVIASVTQPFCGDCTRARISAEGRLYTCLFAMRGHDLRALVRGGASDEELRAEIDRVWGARTDRYSELRTEQTAALPKVEMSYIGG
jgi:cyclic pyranopterin phosphate synthase